MGNKLLAAMILLAFGGATSVSAQSVFNPNPTTSVPAFPRPALNPYLNLLRGGDPAANLYLGVYPEINRRQFQSQLSSYLLESQQPRLSTEPVLDDRAELELRERRLPPSGHTSGFMIYNGYFTMPNQRSFIPYNPGAGRSNPQAVR